MRISHHIDDEMRSAQDMAAQFQSGAQRRARTILSDSLEWRREGEQRRMWSTDRTVQSVLTDRHAGVLAPKPQTADATRAWHEYVMYDRPVYAALVVAVALGKIAGGAVLGAHMIRTRMDPESDDAQKLMLTVATCMLALDATHVALSSTDPLATLSARSVRHRFIKVCANMGVDGILGPLLNTSMWREQLLPYIQGGT